MTDGSVLPVLFELFDWDSFMSELFGPSALGEGRDTGRIPPNSEYDKNVLLYISMNVFFQL